jgi:hypothetical protein
LEGNTKRASATGAYIASHTSPSTTCLSSFGRSPARQRVAVWTTRVYSKRNLPVPILAHGLVDSGFSIVAYLGLEQTFFR